MTVHYLKPHLPCSCCETEMPAAPAVVLPNGKPVIPQHYLQFEQNLVSLQEILADVETLPQFLLFADEDTKGLYLQVGMIGRENYDRGEAIRPQKLVYGRKWRIDSNTPTSEIIQTAFLAVKKAREHEVREMFTLLDKATEKTSAPFSTHQDLPLMAGNADLFLDEPRFATINAAEQLQNLLSAWRFGERTLELSGLTLHKNQFILDIKLGQAPEVRRLEGELPEYDNWEFSFIIQDLNEASVLHRLMDEFIRLSDTLVAEQFFYRDFARFSSRINPQTIASLSIASRPYARDMKNEDFAPTFRKLNYQTDAERVPKLGKGPLAEKNRSVILAQGFLLGHMPIDLHLQSEEKNDIPIYQIS